jgi:hypothetical protein
MFIGAGDAGALSGSREGVRSSIRRLLRASVGMSTRTRDKLMQERLPRLRYRNLNIARG